jgi:hypothetical protein
MLSRRVPLKNKSSPPASAQHGCTGISLQDERAISTTGAHIASQLEYIDNAGPPSLGAHKVSRPSYWSRMERRVATMLDGIWPGLDNKLLLFHFISHHLDRGLYIVLCVPQVEGYPVGRVSHCCSTCSRLAEG